MRRRLAREASTRASSVYVAARAFTATARGVDDDDLRAAFRHCVQLVRARDYETYLCTLSLPRERAPVAFAVRALNAETGSIVGNAESARAALARLMWWRETIGDGASGAATHPVATAISASFGGAPSARARRWMKNMIDARIRDAETEGPPRDVKELERYASDAHGSALTLALDACGIRDADADHAASHLGKAVGLSALLRGTVAHARQRRCYLPTDACATPRLGAKLSSTYPQAYIKGVKTTYGAEHLIDESASTIGSTSWPPAKNNWASVRVAAGTVVDRVQVYNRYDTVIPGAQKWLSPFE